MNKDLIVQFVCFTSHLDPAGFMEMWQPYAKRLVNDPANIMLQEGVAEVSASKFNYVSQHVCSSTEFRFAFLKERSTTHFPEHKARVKQAGGYMPVQSQSPSSHIKGDAKIIAFIAHGEAELDFYRGQTFHYLNIYEAYFESCAYSYVMEFFLGVQEAPALLALLKTRPGVEAALYKECQC